MNRKMHVHCVCGGLESEYISGREGFILGPRLGGGQQVFSSLQGGGKEIFLSSLGGTDVFQHLFLISGAPGVLRLGPPSGLKVPPDPQLQGTMTVGYCISGTIFIPHVIYNRLKEKNINFDGKTQGKFCTNPVTKWVFSTIS